MCHRLFGANRSAATETLEANADLNSLSIFPRLSKFKSLSTSPTSFSLLIKVKASSIARRRIEMSGSSRQPKIVLSCLRTALGSMETTLWRVFNATYRILLSLLVKNFPRILIPRVVRPLSASMSKIASTAS